MSTSAPILDCTCHLTAGRGGCPIHGPRWLNPQAAVLPGPCNGVPHDFAVGAAHAICNRCEKVVTL